MLMWLDLGFYQDDGAATELMNTQPLLKFVRIICKRNCPETADLVAGLLLQLSKSLEPHLTLTFWGGSDDLREWKKLLETCANKENSTNVSLLAIRALSRLAKVSHNRPGLTGPRYGYQHTNLFWTLTRSSGVAYQSLLEAIDVARH